MTEPDSRDLLCMADVGDAAVGVYKDGTVKIGVGDESMWTSAKSLFDMMRYYSAAGFRLTSPTPEMLDAQRYRYLRDVAGQVSKDTDGPMVCAGLGDYFDYLRGSDVDKAVDDAMAHEKESK